MNCWFFGFIFLLFVVLMVGCSMFFDFCKIEYKLVGKVVIFEVLLDFL